MKSFLLVAFLVFAFCNVEAQRAGTLDSSFGENGKVIDPATYRLTVNVSALQKDEKLVVAGEKNSAFILKRYLKDGSIDTTFGNEGMVITQIKNTHLNGIAREVLVQLDQKIIIVADGQPNNYGGSFVLARYLPDGTIDSTFGIEGIVINYNDNEATNDVAHAAILQTDGNIVVGGTRSNFFSTDFILKRYLSNGVIDKSFGIKGTVITEVDNQTQDELTSLVYQPDGKVIAGGYTSEGGNLAYRKFALCRYLPTGQLDNTFGKEGVTISDLKGEGEEINAMNLQKDGKIIAAGRSNVASYNHLIVAEYNIDGSLDLNFGNMGTTEILYEKMDAHCESVNVQFNDKIILTGWLTKDLVTQLSDFILVRVNSNGSLDSTFGINAKVSTDFGAYDYCYSSNLQGDGKVICVGQQYPQDGSSETNILLARYYGDPIHQQSPIVKKIKRWIRNHTLNWQYNADVDYFVIEQSSNGINGFKEVAKVKAVNRQSLNVNDVYTYNLNDFANSQQLKANSKTYYRITAVSNNNKVVSTVISDENVMSITISPNPVKDVMKISGLPANQKTTINVVNRNGNILQSAVCNSSVCMMNVGELKSGLYNVQVNVNSKTQTLKFVKE